MPPGRSVPRHLVLNCYLHALDVFVKRELRCTAYLRYVDDFALFADDKSTLWRWKRAIIERLAHLRLRVHEASAQAVPTSSGMPWLGFVVYPYVVRVKARKVRYGDASEGLRTHVLQAFALPPGSRPNRGR